MKIPFTPFNIIIQRPPGPILDPVWWSSEARRIEGSVVSVLRDGYGVIQDVSQTKNLITDSGDLFYSYFANYIIDGSGVIPTTLFTDGASPSVFDGVMEVYTGTNTPTKSSTYDDLTAGNLVAVSGTVTEKAITGGYPKRADGTAANSGKATDAITYKYAYAQGELIGNSMDGVIICNPSPSPTNDQLLMWASGLGRTKTTNDELDIYVNHLMAGASS